MQTAAFLDTNVFLYAASADPADAVRKARAQQLIRETAHAVSPQVIAEFIDNAQRKARLGIPAERLRLLVALMLEGLVVPLDAEVVRRAWELQQAHGLRINDAQILAAAEAAGCGCVYSEDLSHGQRYGRVQVVNPFRD